MARPKPPAVPLHQLSPGQLSDTFALLAERTRGATREGKPYYLCRFRDRRRTVGVMVWSDSPRFADCERDWQAGRAYKLRGTFGDHDKYGPQFDLVDARPATDDDRADGYDPAALVEASRFDPAEMLTRLRALVESIADEPLRHLVLAILDQHGPRLAVLPASPRHYSPFAGGWLEHALAVAELCGESAARYTAHFPDLSPPISRDLLIAGAVLHNVGRVREFADDFGSELTVEGRLLGHVALGRDLVREAAAGVAGLHPERLLLLDHLIQSHLKLPEWGSPRLPAIPECIVLFHAVDLHAKVEMYARCLQRDAGPGPFTERDPALGQMLLKGRSV